MTTAQHILAALRDWRGLCAVGLLIAIAIVA